jgi:hypothetical protein
MQIAKVQFDPKLILGPADSGDLAPRSPGLHLSQIYHSLEEELSADTAKRRGNIPLAKLEEYRAGGFVWEHVMQMAMANALASEEWQRPGEFTLDGIIGSPDLIGVRDWVVGETKFTWKSSRHLETMEQGTGPLWVWLVQMKGYCRMIGTQHARLFAYFVNGNYKDGYKPELHVLDFTFSIMELNENWNMIKAHARKKGWLK